MTLKYIVDHLNDVPETLRAEYEPTADGKFRLAVDSLPETADLVSALRAERATNKALKAFGSPDQIAVKLAAADPTKFNAADLFVSADEPWMDEVAAKGLIVPSTRKSFLANKLVLIAPADSKLRLNIARGFPIARALGDGRLALADPDGVPAGKYGKAALEALSVWPGVSDKVASAENVRAALALVERGAAPLGIVYATDAKASARVRVVGTFPANSHPAITYPLARLKAATNRDAEPFRRFLLSKQGQAIFIRYGFSAK